MRTRNLIFGVWGRGSVVPLVESLIEVNPSDRTLGRRLGLEWLFPMFVGSKSRVGSSTRHRATQRLPILVDFPIQYWPKFIYYNHTLPGLSFPTVHSNITALTPSTSLSSERWQTPTAGSRNSETRTEVQTRSFGKPFQPECLPMYTRMPTYSFAKLFVNLVVNPGRAPQTKSSGMGRMIREAENLERIGTETCIAAGFSDVIQIQAQAYSTRYCRVPFQAYVQCHSERQLMRSPSSVVRASLIDQLNLAS